MNALCRLLGSSLGKKYLMALSGLILAGFVLGHMVGNLQVFLPPHWINTYAHHLQTLPYGLLWVVRLALLTAVGVHIWTSVVLTLENRKARPQEYEAKATLQASLASRTMIYSGLVVGAFLVFHLLHYTTKSVFDYSELHGFVLPGVEEPVMNVYAMMYMGFSKWYVSLFYLVATFLLCQHLSHGFASVFQSLGMRNHTWRDRLERLSLAYGWVVFLGFAAIPVAVLLDYHTGLSLFDTSSFAKTLEAARACCGAGL